MNVWIRIYGFVEPSEGEVGARITISVDSKIGIVIHRNEKSARDAAAKFGGLVLEVAASSLKGVSEFPDASLSPTDPAIDGDGGDQAKADTTAYMHVACDDIPYKTVFQSFTTGEYHDAPPKDAGYQELMQFTKDGEAYLDALSAELGDLALHQ